MRFLLHGLTTLALACMQAGCSSSSDPAPSQDTGPRAVRTTLGLSADELIASAPLVMFGVSEVDQGGVDLNGDGDALDVVLHVYDERTGAVTSTGLAQRAASDPATRTPVIFGDRSMFAVSEEAQGADLNGDGDQADHVAHSFDVTTGATENHGLAVVPATRGMVLGDARFAVLVVSEHDQGMADWNGDADSDDGMVHILDLETGDVVRHPDPLGYLEWSNVGVLDGHLFFIVKEATAGRDLNGDGDTEEWTVFVGKLDSGLIVNTALCAYVAPALPGGVWVLRIDEQAQGGTDLDGDGDASALVLASYDFASGELRNHGVSVSPLGWTNAGVAADRVAISAQEAASQDDWNGDGDQDDDITVLLDPTTGAATSTGLDGSWHLYPRLDGQFAFPIREENTNGGTDLNGDGDVDDRVMQLVDPATGGATNLAVDVTLVLDPWLLAFAMERFLPFYRSEADNAQDWNQDGDMLDDVLTWWDANTGAFRRTPRSVARTADLQGSTILVQVSEPAEGRDLNQDGDALDDVLFAIDLATGAEVNLRTTAGEPHLLAEDRLLVSVPEIESGEDLNADGDVDDEVLVVFDLFR